MDKANIATEQSRTTQGRGRWPSTNSAGFYTVARQLHLTGRMQKWPLPVVARSKAWVCGRSLAGNAGSNAAGGLAVC